MKFVILDLEWNGAYSRRLKGFMNEIIECGAVKVDEKFHILDTFEMFIRPQVGKKISGKISDLTSITNEDLADGPQFLQVVSRFRRWTGDAVVMTWGTSDILALIENYRYFCGNRRIPFLKQYVNLQAYCERCLSYDRTKQMGLSTAAQLLEIDDSDLDHHRALADSMLSLRCFQRLYNPEKLKPFLQDAETEEFYNRMEFRTVTVCDLNHPQIKASDLAFCCDLCGRRARRSGKWQLRNKSFRAPFICKHCGHRFYGRVQFKLKYEGMIVKKAVLPFQEEPKSPEEAQSAETPKESE
ncbi:exonuclease domain-containing protein [Caproicibacter sp.]|uniref:exonuclease domain-containing protein n=1 Tax=Caproicibacter sp. TaxID=2814884 RepID=UPI0039893D99